MAIIGIDLGTVCSAMATMEAGMVCVICSFEGPQITPSVVFFPEGTSTDSMRVLPFKSALFAAFYTHGMSRIMQIQPVTVLYHAPAGEDARYYGWWGDMTFSGHLLQVLATKRPGRVEVIFHPEVPVDAFADRKQLAAHCERVIRASHVLAAQVEI